MRFMQRPTVQKTCVFMQRGRHLRWLALRPIKCSELHASGLGWLEAACTASTHHTCPPTPCNGNGQILLSL